MPRGYHKATGEPIVAGRTPTPATPEQIACYGHIAIFLRQFLEHTGMTRSDFNEHVLDTDRKSSGASLWVNAKGAPAQATANRMAKVLGVPAGFFRPVSPGDPPPKQPASFEVPASWGQRQRFGSLAAAVGPQKLLIADPAPGPSMHPSYPPPPAQAPPRKPLVGFTLNDDGTARLTVDVTLDTKRATSLFRVLLEAGLEDAAG